MLDPERFDKPVFLCQGLALVEEVIPGKIYLFLEPVPSCGFDIGDTMPEEWSIIPANRAARELLHEDLDSFELLVRTCPPSTW